MCATTRMHAWNSIRRATKTFIKNAFKWWDIAKIVQKRLLQRKGQITKKRLTNYNNAFRPTPSISPPSSFLLTISIFLSFSAFFPQTHIALAIIIYIDIIAFDCFQAEKSWSGREKIAIRKFQKIGMFSLEPITLSSRFFAHPLIVLNA